MKHNVIIFGAIALLGLAACQKETEKTAPDSPFYNPDTQTVKADFVLTLSTTTGKDTKTTAQYAQVNSDFLGMEAVHLLTYALPYAHSTRGNFIYRPTDFEEYKPISATRDFNLGALFPENAITASKASRSMELSLPLGTNSVLLYGKAKKTLADDIQGKVSLGGDPNDLTTVRYSLCSRLSNQNAFDAGAFVLSKILNYLLVAGLVNEQSFWTTAVGVNDGSYAFWYPLPSPDATLPDSPTDGQVSGLYTYHKGQLAWKQLGIMATYADDNKPETVPNNVVQTESGQSFTHTALGGTLGRAYLGLTTIKQTESLKELRAGSSVSVLHTIQDLYSIIDRSADAEPMSWEEEAVKRLAQNIRSRILVFFAQATDGSLDYIRDSDGDVDVEGLLAKLEVICFPGEWNSKVGILEANLDPSFFPDTEKKAGFPVNIGLPFGAAILDVTLGENVETKLGIDSFKYITDIPAYGFGSTTFPIANYRFPAELMYFGNSPIRVSNEVKKSSDYPGSVSAWDTESQWATGWTNKGTVQSTTRAVAMVNNINYGTALLASTCQYAQGVTALKDNNSVLHEGEQDNVIPVTAQSGSGLVVTGIIVAGQADVVGWDYTRYPDSGAYSGFAWNTTDKKFDNANFAENPFDKMIYDRVYTPFAVGATNTVYTMVWDNYDATKSADAQSDVYVAVELVNSTGEDFWGEMNLVRNGGVFYLLGKLDLATAVTNARTNNSGAFTDLSRDYYCYPPFDPANGNTINAPRVFMQDYMTTANLVFGEDCLKHAYVTVPDLRSSQVSLGVSVDMAWTPGLAFEVDMGKLN